MLAQSVGKCRKNACACVNDKRQILSESLRKLTDALGGGIQKLRCGIRKSLSKSADYFCACNEKLRYHLHSSVGNGEKYL